MQATLTAYEGDKDVSGLFHGQGRAVFSSGQVYEGQWQQGHMHGQGFIQFPDGISYSGAFDVDSIHGSGVSVRVVNAAASKACHRNVHCGSRDAVASHYLLMRGVA
jgi:hypothetical protein